MRCYLKNLLHLLLVAACLFFFLPSVVAGEEEDKALEGMTEQDKEKVKTYLKQLAGFDTKPFGSKVAALVSKPLDEKACPQWPQSSVIFTYSDKNTVDYLELQHKSMLINADETACLSQRFVTICLDDQSFDFCTSKNLFNCVLVPGLNKDTPDSSEFGKGAYGLFCFMKYVFVREAALNAQQVFYFDADVLLFRNPFIDVRYNRKDDGTRFEANDMDFFHQREDGKGYGCHGSINSGQMWFKNSSNLHKFLDNMDAIRPTLFTKGQLDQYYLWDAFLGDGNETTRLLKSCSLSVQLYTSHCPKGHLHDSRIMKVVAHHANCLTKHQKLPHLKNFINAVTEKKDLGVGNMMLRKRRRRRRT